MKRKNPTLCLIFAVIMIIGYFNFIEYKIVPRDNKNQSISFKMGEKKKLLSYTDEIRNVKVIAHRGRCSGEVENSLTAIDSSINHKMDFAEVDVQETKDGVVVLGHDRSLKRLSGIDKKVDQLSFNEIEKINIASHLHGQAFVRVPTLDEVIKRCNGKLGLIIEIKSYANTDDLTKKVVEIIDSNNFVNQCKVHSFNYLAILNVKKLNPDIQTGYIISRPITNLGLLNVNFYSVKENIINKNLVHEIHNSNKKIYAWTVDKTSDMDKLLNLGVDGVISNKPILLWNIKNNSNYKKQVATKLTNSEVHPGGYGYRCVYTP